jgi:hypothetical protein
MAVRAEHAGQPAAAALGTIKVPVTKWPGKLSKNTRSTV